MRAGRASATAILVARGVAFSATHPQRRHLVPPRAAEMTESLLEAAGERVPSGSSLLRRASTALLEKLTVPGITLHYVLRKREIERLARASIAGGCEQLVVVGAGLDTLGARLAEEGFPVAEIDHPATQALKRRGLRGAGVDLVPLDLASEPLGPILRRWTSKPLLVVAEAVFLYLEEAAVRRVLGALAARDAPTRIIFSFFAPSGRAAIGFQNATRLADAWLEWKGEPARWAVDPGSLAAFLAAESFQLVELALDEDYQRRHLQAAGPGLPSQLPIGEHIAVAEVSS